MIGIGGVVALLSGGVCCRRRRLSLHAAQKHWRWVVCILYLNKKKYFFSFSSWNSETSKVFVGDKKTKNDKNPVKNFQRPPPPDRWGQLNKNAPTLSSSFPFGVENVAKCSRCNNSEKSRVLDFWVGFLCTPQTAFFPALFAFRKCARRLKGRRRRFFFFSWNIFWNLSNPSSPINPVL